MAEYLTRDSVESVALNTAIPFIDSIPCNKGCVIHASGSGIFVLRGIVNNPSACVARYAIEFTGNIAIPEGGTAGPIAVALAVNGEPRMTSRAIYVPAAAGDANYGNVTSTAIITVPRGCCFTLSLRHVPASDDPTVTPAPVINLQNANIVINRIA